MTFSKSLLLTGFLILISCFYPSKALSDSTYTAAEVATHNSASDCWVTFENSVYDITNYLNLHDRYLDIRTWCGTDMTTAFITKDGLNIDHKSSSYTLLENYYIGQLDNSSPSAPPMEETNTYDDISISDTDAETDPAPQNKNPYNLGLPLLISSVLYGISYFLAKFYTKKGTGYMLQQHNMVWNTVLIILLITSLCFGLCYVLAYNFDFFAQLDFDYTWWHIELGTAMAIIAILHLIQRIRPYLNQWRRQR